MVAMFVDRSAHFPLEHLPCPSLPIPRHMLSPEIERSQVPVCDRHCHSRWVKALPSPSVWIVFAFYTCNTNRNIVYLRLDRSVLVQFYSAIFRFCRARQLRHVNFNLPTTGRRKTPRCPNGVLLREVPRSSAFRGVYGIASI